MRLTYSKSGTPVIDLENNGRLVFSKSTAHPVYGYKFICYGNTVTNSITISGAKAKRVKKAKISEDINFTLNIDSMKRDGKAGPPKNTLRKFTTSYLKNLFGKHMNGVYLPFEAIPLIEKELNYEDETDKWDNDPTATESFDDAVDVVVKPKRAIKKMKPKLKLNGISRKNKK